MKKLKRGMVVCGSEETLRLFDELLDRADVQVFQSEWAKPQDFLKLVTYRRNAPSSTTEAF